MKVIQTLRGIGVYLEKLGEEPTPDSSNLPRSLTALDLTSFEEATAKRPTRPRGPANHVHDFQSYMFSRHQHRMKWLCKELDWLRKQAVKNGVDPEEVRWML